MKELNEYIEAHRQEILQLGEKLFATPELGFKEFRTGKIIRNYLAEHGLKVDREYAITGFSVTIGQGAPHIGVIAELDAIPTRGHPFADPETTAAHACGHSTQQAITLAALDAVNQHLKDLPGTVTLFFTPAEEFTDIEYRKQLVKEGQIRYLSGKENMLAEGLFDDVDCIIHLHAMGSSYYQYSVDSILAGFIYKKITFIGRAAHAAVLPQLGINAINELNLFLNAVNALRETFEDDDMVRVHGMILEGGNTVNSIPDKTVYECYVRSINPEKLIEINEKISNAATHCAAAIGGSCEIEDTPGYLPLHQSPKLSEVIMKHILEYTVPERIHHHEKSAAAGDVGDICMFKPIIQYGYNGFSGRIHGADMKIEDPETVYITQAKIVAAAIMDLLQHPETVRAITDEFTPKMTLNQYLDYLNGK